METSLLSRFKEIYCSQDYEIAWSKIDSEGNLTVGIRSKETKKEVFWLHVKEDDNGKIIWF